MTAPTQTAVVTTIINTKHKRPNQWSFILRQFLNKCLTLCFLCVKMTFSEVQMKNNPKKEQIFDYIAKHIQKHGYAPSVRDICKALSITSTATVAYNIEKLKQEGKINKTDFKNRTLSISGTNTQPQSNVVSIPLVGQVAAGLPILATESIEETYSIPANMFRSGNLFMLNVKGNSMIDAGIFDGDKVVVRQQNTAEKGEIVCALVENEATIKRFFPENGHIRLQPENKTMQPIIVPSCEILGIVVGSIRNF